MRNNYLDRTDSTPRQQSSGGFRDYYNTRVEPTDDTKVTPWSVRDEYTHD